MDPKTVLPDQLADENYIERLFPKCSPKYTNEQSQSRTSNFTTSNNKRQNRAKVHQHSRRELEARRNKRRGNSIDRPEGSLKGNNGFEHNSTSNNNNNSATGRVFGNTNSNNDETASTSNKLNRVASSNHRSALHALSSESSDDERIGRYISMRKSRSMNLARKPQVTDDSQPTDSSTKLITTGKRRPGKYVPSQNLLQQLQRSHSGASNTDLLQSSSSQVTHTISQQPETRPDPPQKYIVKRKDVEFENALASTDDRDQRVNPNVATPLSSTTANEIVLLDNNYETNKLDQKYNRKQQMARQLESNPVSQFDAISDTGEIKSSGRALTSTSTQPELSNRSMTTKHISSSSGSNKSNYNNNDIVICNKDIASKIDDARSPLDHSPGSFQLGSQIESLNFYNDKTNIPDGSDGVNDTKIKNVDEGPLIHETDHSVISGSGLTNNPSSSMCSNTESSQKDEGKYINLFVYDNNVPTTKIERKLADSYTTVSTQTRPQPDMNLSSTSSSSPSSSSTPAQSSATANVPSTSTVFNENNLRQSYNRNIQDNDTDTFQNLISIQRHHPSHKLLTVDLHEDEQDRDNTNIVSNDASTEELCANDKVIESIDMKKRSIAATKDKRNSDQALSASNSSSPSASNISTPTVSPKRRFSADVACPPAPVTTSPKQQATTSTLSSNHQAHQHHHHHHHHRSSLTGISTLQTVDEKAEINNIDGTADPLTNADSIVIKTSKQELQLSRSIDDTAAEEVSNVDSPIGKIPTNNENLSPVPHQTGHIRKPPGFPQRIKPQQMAEGVCSINENLTTSLVDTNNESNGSDRANDRLNQEPSSKAPLQQQPGQQKRAQQKADRQVRFDLPTTSSDKTSDTKLELPQAADQSSISSSNQHCDQLPIPAAKSYEDSKTNHENEQKPREMREISVFEHESIAIVPSRACNDDYVDIMDKKLAAAINKVSLSSNSQGDNENNNRSIESVPTANGQQLVRQQPQTVPETHITTTARHHKLPNESSHYSIVRSNTTNVMTASNNSHIISTKPPNNQVDAPPRSASLQFNNLSDGESGSDDRPPVSVSNNSKVLSANAASTTSEEKTSTNEMVDTLTKVLDRTNLTSNHQNDNLLSNNNEDDQTPTTKTALIFPRLDEGLSSEAESADDGGTDGEDDQAMEADVDADDDEEDDDDDEDDDDEDIDDELHNTPPAMSVMNREAQQTSIQSAIDLYVRSNAQQQTQQSQHPPKPLNKILSKVQQPQQQQQQQPPQQQQSQSSSILPMTANQNEHSDLQQQHAIRSQCTSFNCVNQNSIDQSDMKPVTSFPNQNGGQPNYWMAVPNQQTGISGQTTPGQVYGGQQRGPNATNNNNNNNSSVSSQTKQANLSSFNREEATKVPSRLSSDTDNETDRLLGSQRSEQLNKMTGGANLNNAPTDNQPISNFKQGSSSREVLIEGVLFNVKYLGSTHTDCEGRGEKEDRIHQAEMAVHEVKIRNGDSQSAIDVQLFISTEKIMVLDDKHRKIMMDHSLRTISYIADIGDAIVLIVRKKSTGTDATHELGRPISRISCHVFESSESHTITKSISQAFQVAYTELLKANGAGDASSYLPKEIDYQEVLNSQEMSTEELEMFARKENQHEVIVPKKKGEILGVSIVESGWGSVLPTVVIASIKQDGPAYRCKKLSVGDQILSINGISLVGLPLAECQEILRKTRKQTVARLSVVPCPITVEVKIKRPDTKYQLGFSVQNGVICSLLRGGIAERGGVRVGHRIMSINGTTVVGVPHEKIVTLLASSVGEIRMKTCLTSLYRLILGEENPVHF